MKNYLLSVKTFTNFEGSEDFVIMNPSYQTICANSWLQAVRSAKTLQALIKEDKRTNNDISFHDCEVDVIGEF